jgi:MscS family membrane protein
MPKLGLLLLLLPLLLPAQATAPAPAPAPTPALDPYGRTSPQGAFLGFLKNAHSGDFPRAIQYMQFQPQTKEKERLELARRFLFILDRGYIGTFDNISALATGRPNDGLPADRESIGAIAAGGQSIEVQMVRLPESGNAESGNSIWLISRETVESIPDLFPEFGFPWMESKMPEFLIRTHILSMPLWVLIAIIGALPVALLLSWAACAYILRQLPSSLDPPARPSRSIVLLMGMLVHVLISRILGLPLLYRLWYERAILLLGLLIAVWVAFALISYIDARIQAYLKENKLHSTQAMLQLGRRLVKFAVVLVALLVGLRSLGYDISAALAGLGIGGLALAFAAQKTLENLFGGFSLLSDESIRVGDACQFGAIEGTVEDIGLRATRFRTVKRTVLYIPNGQLATMNIENIGQRDKILFRHTINVLFSTGPDGLRKLLADLRDLLTQDERFDPEGLKVRLLKLGAYSLEIEMFAYVKTGEWNLFLEIQEEVLLRVMDIVKANGTDFALPSQTLYMEGGDLKLESPLGEPQVK